MSTPGYPMCRYCGIRTPSFPGHHARWCPDSDFGLARDRVIAAAKVIRHERNHRAAMQENDEAVDALEALEPHDDQATPPPAAGREEGTT